MWGHEKKDFLFGNYSYRVYHLNFSVFYKNQFEKIQLIRTYKIFLEKSEISADGVKETLETEESKVLNEKWMIQKFYFLKYFVTSLRSKRRLRTEENKVLTEGWMPQKFYSVKYFVIYLGTCRMLPHRLLVCSSCFYKNSQQFLLTLPTS